MAVVAAGVHLAGVDRDVVEVVALVDVQRVEVGPQTDGPAVAVRPNAVQHADDAGGGEPGVDLDTERLELLDDHGRGALFLERGLGVGVDVAPPRLQVVVKLSNAIDDGHGPASPSDW